MISQRKLFGTQIHPVRRRSSRHTEASRPELVIYQGMTTAQRWKEKVAALIKFYRDRRPKAPRQEEDRPARIPAEGKQA
jgi:hypothetical protein